MVAPTEGDAEAKAVSPEVHEAPAVDERRAKRPKATKPAGVVKNRETVDATNPFPWDRLETNSKSVSIINPSPAVRAALENVGVDDPGVLLDWHIEQLNAAVSHANAQRPALPAWLPGVAYPITTEQFQLAMANELARAGGGQQHGRSLLAPNTDLESNCILVRARDFMLADPFCAEICSAPGQHPIARLYLLGDGRCPMNGVHHPLPPMPAGFGVGLFD